MRVRPAIYSDWRLIRIFDFVPANADLFVLLPTYPYLCSEKTNRFRAVILRCARLYSGANTKRGTVFVTMTGTERMQIYMRYEKNKNNNRNIVF